MLRKTNVKETVKTAKRDVERSGRDVERQITELKRQEQKTVQEIKQLARQGRDADVRIMAKSLIRIRENITRLTSGRAQLRGVSTQMTSVGATHTVATAMKTSTAAMAAVGKATQPEKLQQTLAQFLKENEKMGMTEELMEDAFDVEGVDDEADEVMHQVLDEIGLDLSSELSKTSAPRTRVAATKSTAAPQSESEEEKLLRQLGIQ